jgi:transposase
MDARGKILLRRKIARGQLQSCLANVPVCLIGMEACAGAHHVGRQLAALGHDVRLLPAQYVKPFLKGHKRYHDGHGGVGAELGGSHGSNSGLGSSGSSSGN